jgi:hypothetical protein
MDEKDPHTGGAARRGAARHSRQLIGGSSDDVL